MAQPYVGEIRMFGGNFAPAGWMFCEGQLLPISENETLFNLIGTTYGGDGQTTFALPDLRSRVPVHQTSNTFSLCENVCAEMVTLPATRIPGNAHTAQAATTSQGVNIPAGNVWAASPAYNEYSAAPDSPMSPQALSSTGGDQQHDNMV